MNMDEHGFGRLMAPFMRRVRLMLGRAVVTVVNDTLKAQNVQIGTLNDDTPEDVERLQNYGQISVPLAGAEAIIGCIGADRDHAVVLIVEDRRYRPTGLVAGDSGVYHFEGHRIRLTKDGRCIITCKTLEIFADESATIDTPKTILTGDVEIQKNLTVAGDTHVQGGFDVEGESDFKAAITAPNAILNGIDTVQHVHDENGDGGGTTDPMR